MSLRSVKFIPEVMFWPGVNPDALQFPNVILLVFESGIVSLRLSFSTMPTSVTFGPFGGYLVMFPKHVFSSVQ